MLSARRLKELRPDVDDVTVLTLPGARRDQRGTALTEFAIVLPVFVAFLLAVVTGGTAYSSKVGVVEAVREGARFGASLRLGTGQTAVADWEAAVKNRVVSASGGEIALASVCAKLVLPTGGTDCGQSDPTGASAESTVNLVKVSASKDVTLEFFFFRTTKTITGRLTARYERDTG